jgi:hypothetical protein
MADAIRIDGVLVGGGRLSWPAQTDETEVPAWLIFSAMIRLTVVQGRESGLRPQFGALDELGFEVTDASVIISSFSHHLMAGFHEWQEIGAGPLARRWLDRFSSREGMAHFNDTGDLLVGAESSAANLAPRSLAQALLSPPGQIRRRACHGFEAATYAPLRCVPTRSSISHAAAPGGMGRNGDIHVHRR